MISPCKEIGQSWILNSAPWILHSVFFVSGTWILDSNYKWDPEYLTFISDSKRKISQIPDSLRWGDSDPKINTFSVKPKPVNWASNYCRLSVHVLVTACCSCHHMLEKGVCGHEIVAMIMKQLSSVLKFGFKKINCFKGCIYHCPLNKQKRKGPAASWSPDFSCRDAKAFEVFCTRVHITIVSF